MTSPNDIQNDIERTREQLSTNVDRLSEKVSPGKAVGRQVDSVKKGASALRDRVMGSGEDNTGLRGAGDSLGSTVSGLSDAAGNAPQAVRRQTQGNPLAAGIIAFGVGWLLSSLAPASQAEQQVAARAEDKAKDLAEPLKATGAEMAQNLKPAVQESVEQVKSTATDAAQQTADHASGAAEDVKRTAQG